MPTKLCERQGLQILLVDCVSSATVADYHLLAITKNSPMKNQNICACVQLLSSQRKEKNLQVKISSEISIPVARVLLSHTALSFAA